MMRKRKRLHDKYKRSNNIVDFENFKLMRNRVTSEIRKSKHNQTHKLAQKLANDASGPKDWWKTLKKFIKPGQCSSLSPLTKNGDIYSEDMDKANLLNQLFCRTNTSGRNLFYSSIRYSFTASKSRFDSYNATKG